MTTVLFVDGVGVHDLRGTYVNPTRYAREDEDDRIVQAEGQGDPLMPLLFSLTTHDPLQEAQRDRAKEHFFVFLDDVCFISGGVRHSGREVVRTRRNHVKDGLGRGGRGRRESEKNVALYGLGRVMA